MSPSNHRNVLITDGPFTLFAPTNEAFRSLPTEVLARLMASPEEMKRVLTGHVTKGTYFLGALDSKDSGTDSVLPTLDGGSNKIMISGRSKEISCSFILCLNRESFFFNFQPLKWTGHRLLPALIISWQTTESFMLFLAFLCPTEGEIGRHACKLLATIRPRIFNALLFCCLYYI